MMLAQQPWKQRCDEPDSSVDTTDGQASREEIQRLKDELAALTYAVSHDLREPLRAMDGFSKVLLEQYGSSLDEKGRHYLGRVLSGAERMSRLMDGLLTLSRVTQARLFKKPVALGPMAEEILARRKAQCPHRHVVWSIDSVPEVKADPHMARTVLEILLDNAWKFTEGAEVQEIEFGASRLQTPVFFVKDSGQGFDKQYVDKLFTPFQRLHSAGQSNGVGMGLATARRIVLRHGGQIWAEGQTGVGATFRFTLGEVRDEFTESD